MPGKPRPCGTAFEPDGAAPMICVRTDRHITHRDATDDRFTRVPGGAYIQPGKS